MSSLFVDFALFTSLCINITVLFVPHYQKIFLCAAVANLGNSPCNAFRWRLHVHAHMLTNTHRHTNTCLWLGTPLFVSVCVCLVKEMFHCLYFVLMLSVFIEAERSGQEHFSAYIQAPVCLTLYGCAINCIKIEISVISISFLYGNKSSAYALVGSNQTNCC